MLLYFFLIDLLFIEANLVAIKGLPSPFWACVSIACQSSYMVSDTLFAAATRTCAISWQIESAAMN